MKFLVIKMYGYFACIGYFGIWRHSGDIAEPPVAYQPQEMSRKLTRRALHDKLAINAKIFIA